MERSFGLLKPDCLRRGIEREVLERIEAGGFRILTQKRVRLTEGQVGIIWSNCKGMPYWGQMVDFSLSGDCIVFLVEGEDAIRELSVLVGLYDPMEAREGTIRHDFGTSAMENVIHSSLGEETFRIESGLFFKEGK